MHLNKHTQKKELWKTGVDNATQKRGCLDKNKIPATKGAQMSP